MIFDTMEFARAELVPVLRAITTLTTESGDERQTTFFGNILAGIERAKESEDLADPLMALSTSAFMGFEMDAATTWLLDDLLGKAQELAAALDAEPDELH